MFPGPHTAAAAPSGAAPASAIASADAEPRDDDTALYPETQDLAKIPKSYRRLVQRLWYLEQHPPAIVLEQPQTVGYAWRLYLLAILSYARTPRLFVPTRPIPLTRLISGEALDPALFGHFARYRSHFVCTQQPRRFTSGPASGGAESDPLYTLLRRAWPHQCQLKHFRRRLMSLFHRTSDPISVSATDFVCRAQILFTLGMYRTAFAPVPATGRGPSAPPLASAMPPLPPLAALGSWTHAWVSSDGHADLHAMALRRAPLDLMDWVWAIRELMVFMMEADAAFTEWLATHTDWNRYRDVIRSQCQRWRQGEALDTGPVPVDQRCTVSVAGDFWLVLGRGFTTVKVPVPTLDPFWVYQMARCQRFAWRLFPLMRQAHHFTIREREREREKDDVKKEVPDLWWIPSDILPHEQGRYLRHAHLIHCIFERLLQDHIRPVAVQAIVALLKLHCGPRLSDTARHNRLLTGLTKLAELDSLAYTVLYSLCTGVHQAHRTTVSFWPRSIVNAQYHQLWIRARQNPVIVTEASHLYVCPCCMEIHSMVQKAASRRVTTQAPRAFTATSVSGMQKTCIDLLDQQLYCARKNGKKAAQCHRTPLVAFPLLGVLLGFAGKFYTLCVGCGIPCEFTGLAKKPAGPQCMECRRRHAK